MPTSSTARILAKKEAQLAAKSANAASNGTHYEPPPRLYASRRRRPKSCKYDSYRLRSRTSVVEENLFGEPLKNKLMTRSKSMEAIASQENDRLFIRRNTTLMDERRRERSERPERPKTALATMRTGRAKEEEFQGNNARQKIQIIAKDHVRSLIVPQDQERPAQPLILTRREFEKILQAAKVLSPSERAAQRRRQQEESEALAKATEERKEMLAASAQACATERPLTEADLEAEKKKHHILERAEVIKDEALPEVKKLNEWIMEAKCNAIRDMQKQEQQKRLEEMAEADRHLEEEMEAERQRAVEMANARSKKLEEFHLDYRAGLKQQKEEQEALKLLELEQRELELRVRREIEREQREKEEQEKERKKRRSREMRRQMVMDLKEAQMRKEEEIMRIKQEEDRILALQDARRKAEIEREDILRQQKREAEREKVKMKGQIEQEQELLRQREATRLIRQQEEQDRRWRQQELMKEELKAKREEDVRVIRDEQIRQKMDSVAKAIEREKEHWEKTKDEWKEETGKEEQAHNRKMRKKKEYLLDLQTQMEMNKIRSKSKEKESQQPIEPKQVNQERIEKIRERKLQQLRAYNVPEKYLKEIEKKCQHMAKTRFTLSYFGKK